VLLEARQNAVAQAEEYLYAYFNELPQPGAGSFILV